MDDFVFCSVISGINKIEFKENIEGIQEWPHSWPDGEISYRLNNRTPDFLERWQERAVTVSLRAWQLRIQNLRFRRERNPDSMVDFNVSFEPSSKFSSRNVFAHAWFPGQGDISGDVEINDESWDWVASSRLQDLAHPPLVPVLVHEFGHCLGLRHDTLISSQNTEIMYPSFNLGRKKNALGGRTVQRIQERYGIRSLSQRWLDYFLRRRTYGLDFK